MGRRRVSTSPASSIQAGEVWVRRKNPLGEWRKTLTYTYNPLSNGRQYASVDTCVDELHKGPPYRSGGPLNVVHFSDGGLSLAGGGTCTGDTATYYYQYRGGFLCAAKKPKDFFGANISDIDSSEFTTGFGSISLYGPTAWNKFKPGKPKADLALFVAELRDVPRMLRNSCSFFVDLYRGLSPFRKRTFQRSVRRAGGDYLNVQFGWLPFLSDLRKFYHTWANLDKLIKQLRRDNGQWIQRRGTVDEESEDEIIQHNANSHMHWPSLSSNFYPAYPSYGNSTVSVLYKRRVWFSGRFRYYIPDIGSVKWERRAARSLFGANVTPALIWEATPWSWLIDWFSNAGDVIANMDNGLANNLTAKYAYVMGTTKKIGRVVSNANYSPLQSATWDYQLEEKVRTEASPFGFGLTWDDLTSRQWSILSALGFDRILKRW